MPHEKQALASCRDITGHPTTNRTFYIVYSKREATRQTQAAGKG